MFKPRKTRTGEDLCDADGVKIYTISASGEAVDLAPYREQLAQMKQHWRHDWRATAAFAIFHDGAGARYLVLGFWGNDNELLTRVAVKQGQEWLVDPDRYSFCLWDLEVMWEERNIFVETLYSGEPSLADYRSRRPKRWL